METTSTTSQKSSIERGYEIQNLGLLKDEQLNDAQLDIVKGPRAALGFVPNMYRAMINQPALLSHYLDGYNRFRQETGFTPAEQEVVFLALSIDNTCDYCTAAHSMIADKVSGVPAEVLEAMRAGRPLPDVRLHALYETAAAVSNTRGRPDPVTIKAFLEAGYNETDLLSIVLALSVKVISNYTNHFFDTPVDDPFVPYKN